MNEFEKMIEHVDNDGFDVTLDYIGTDLVFKVTKNGYFIESKYDGLGIAHIRKTYNRGEYNVLEREINKHKAVINEAIVQAAR